METREKGCSAIAELAIVIGGRTVNRTRKGTPFLCPECRSPLRFEENGSSGRCALCDREVGQIDDFLDLSPRGKGIAEQAYYEDVYADEVGASLADARSAWASLYYPMNRAVLKRVGDVRGKTVVLLGNGTSEKELLFLEQEPALLVFSDLSPTAVRTVRQHRYPDGRPNLVFAAMDAQELPLADASVDVLYGMPSCTTCPTSMHFWERPRAYSAQADARFSWMTPTRCFGKERNERYCNRSCGIFTACKSRRLKTSGSR